MRIVIAVAFAAFVGMALAVTLPPDANMFVTDDDGVIVGVGRSQAGETFVLDVIASYQGFARLVVVTSDGDVVVHDVVVTGGTVLLEFVDLRAIARRSGFVEVFVEAIDVFDAAPRRAPAGAPASAWDTAPDVGQPGSVGAPEQPADAGHADQAPAGGAAGAPTPADPVPAPPVGGPTDPPAGSPATPATPGAPGSPATPATPATPGPPASTPGLPDGPPAHGQGGAPGGGAPGPDAPTTDGEDGDVDQDDDRPRPPGQDRRP